MKKLKKILLIDDDTISTWLNKAMLEKTGLVEQVESICDGKSAIAYLQECCSSLSTAASACPDIIFLDLDMPVVSGFDLLEQLQQSPNCAWLIADRIVVLTTSIYYKDMQRAQAYPIRDFLVKPLTQTTIKSVLGRFLDAGGDTVLLQQHRPNDEVHSTKRSAFLDLTINAETVRESMGAKV